MSTILRMISTPDFLYSILRISTPLVLGTLSAHIASKAGMTNMAIEGMMLISALLGVLFSAWLGQAWGAFFLVLIIGAGIGLLMTFLIEVMEANSIMTGIALNLIFTGLSIFLLFIFTGEKGVSASIKSYQMPIVHIPVIESIPIVGVIVSGHNVVTYIAYILVAIMYIFVNKTQIGLRIRAVGENELAAKSVGIKTLKLKLLSMALSGILAAAAGCYLSMGYLSMFNNGMTSGRGFISLSANAMSGGSVIGGMLVSMLFGVADTIANWAQQSMDVPVQLIQMIPYIFVVVALVVYNINKNMRAKKNIMAK